MGYERNRTLKKKTVMRDNLYFLDCQMNEKYICYDRNSYSGILIIIRLIKDFASSVIDANALGSNL